MLFKKSEDMMAFGLRQAIHTLKGGIFSINYKFGILWRKPLI